MSGDTNDLLLRDIERSVARAIVALESEKWEEAESEACFISVQARRLATGLGERVRARSNPGEGLL